jgi:hypothetical protein
LAEHLVDLSVGKSADSRAANWAACSAERKAVCLAFR